MNPIERKLNIINGVSEKYVEFLKSVKERIVHSKINVAKKINRELMHLYWSIGEEIYFQQEKNGWGKSVIEKLALDLREEFSFTEGFSARNLWEMRRFYLEYKDTPKLQQLASEIPWGHNLLIITKIKDEIARIYYLEQTSKNGWTRNVLLNQINGMAFERHQISDKKHNFQEVLPIHLAEQADLAMKDIYMLDFLGITNPILERELENRLISKVKDLILELGYGFAFIGNQYKISAGSKEYFIDLLFYHRKLKCLVCLELKSGEFKAEYAGKMNLYLNILDDFVKEKDENPSIGIILCASKDEIEVEYALRGMEKPMGVSEYRLTKELPKELKGTLPTVEDLKKEMK